MNALDAIIILLVIIQAIRWARDGFARGFFSLGGFLAGVFLGALVAPRLLDLTTEPLYQLLLVLGVILLAGAIVGFFGQLVGERLASLFAILRLRWLDNILGAAFSAALTLIIVWLFASMLSGAPFGGLNRQIRDSAVIQAMNEQLPPAPAVLSRLGSLINPHGFPEVFVGPEPRPIEPVDPPTSGELAAALEAAGTSTVRIEGAGCGGLVHGSGFVAAPNLVITNAHVVAGIDRPTVVDSSGRSRATPVLFDPDLDIAILRANDLAGPPLNLTNTLMTRGTTGAVLGYPGGGPLEVIPAGVLRQINAAGRNIYGQGVVVRPVYELQATVTSGNSGGPVTLADGTVIGVVFARSESAADRSYAITSRAVRPLLEEARDSTEAVATGRCVR